MTELKTSCCVAGGGPAGIMLGLLLARAGVSVVVLEKHADFLRDFRGDTIHPSTLDLVAELGLLDEFLRRPHQEITELAAIVGPFRVKVADFSHLPTHCKFLVLMPQWDFLDFLADHARTYPGFDLRMNAEVTDLITDGERVTGVVARTREGELRVLADVVIGADGRSSTVRARAGLEVMNLGSPIDVLWMRVPREPSDPAETLGRIDTGGMLVLINRDDYWQCAYVIRKGDYEQIRARGIGALREELTRLAPFAGDRMHQIEDWDQVKLLSVSVDRLRTWYKDGLLCIGDAAHAMSPIGGVGINLAVQDAVAAANLLAGPLRSGRVTTKDLERVQQRRLMPTRVTQAGQVFVQENIIRDVLASKEAITTLPWPLRLLNRWPVLRRIPARVVGVGLRPEHIKSNGESR